MIFFAILAKPVVIFNFYRELANEYFNYELKVTDGKIHRHSPLRFNVCEYLSSIFWKNDPKAPTTIKKLLFEESKQILNHNLSLSQILNKIVELEKLKFLLLDPNQLILFDYIPKPIISESKADGNVKIISPRNSNLLNKTVTVKNGMTISSNRFHLQRKAIT